jgi:hypothetical protein
MRPWLPAEADWKQHPALAEPDGKSHRGDRMVAATIEDPRVLAELSRRFQQTKPLQLVRHGKGLEVRGAEDFERRQEYLLRLLDYYYFSKERLPGMTRAQVEAIFGRLGSNPDKAEVCGGRDTLVLWFKQGRVDWANYVTGY